MSDRQALVGHDLARRVAERLKAGFDLAYRHPYYCGIGLLHVEGAFIHVQVGDQSYPTLKEALQMEARGEAECRVFPEQWQFVAWLADQSDHSLSGDDNQRLSLARLRAFVEGGENEAE